jgi:hypothetical protein
LIDLSLERLPLEPRLDDKFLDDLAADMMKEDK